MSNLTELLDQIKFHSKKYWVDNDPQISDIEYDNLIRQYINLGGNKSDTEQLFPTIKFTESSEKFKHDVPMLSLDKAYHYSEVIEWAKKIARSDNEEFFVQPKLDGWSGKYINDKLVTRGDGDYGEDISSKLTLISANSPNLTQDFKNTNTSPFIIGEIVLSKTMFKKVQPYLLRSNGKMYKTSRSALTGLLSTKDTRSLNFKPLEFIDYSVFSFKCSLETMMKMNWEFLIAECQEWDYPTDGLVIKLADEEYSISLGSTSHHPRGQIALKYGNPKGKTKVIGVEWFVGKNNTVNPVAIVEPIVIAGHEIKRANLHNAKIMLDMDIKINDEVLVERCGEIIPDIVTVFPAIDRKNIIINECPDCGSNLEYKEPFLYCTNQNCIGSLNKRLTDCCWRLGFKNIGESTILKLIDLGYDDVAKIFNIKRDELFQLPGFAQTSVDNLYNEIQRIKTTPIPDWKVLSCLNINNIGESISERIFMHVNFDKLLEMDLDEFEKIPSIGPERAYNLLIGLDDNNELLTQLFNTLTIIETFGQVKNNKGTVCFTGKMDRERSYYEGLAEAAGYKAVSTVTSDLKYLVTSDLNSTKGKMQKAIKLNIKIISIDDFLFKIEGGTAEN